MERERTLNPVKKWGCNGFWAGQERLFERSRPSLCRRSGVRACSWPGNRNVGRCARAMKGDALDLPMGLEGLVMYLRDSFGPGAIGRL
jgi:hypothetical protein